MINPCLRPRWAASLQSAPPSLVRTAGLCVLAAACSLASAQKQRTAIPNAPTEQALRLRLEKHPYDVASAQALTAQLLAAGREPEARSILLALSERPGASPRMAALLGDFLLQEKSFAPALDAYEKALDMDSSLPEAKLGYRRAAIAFALDMAHQGRGEDALNILMRAGGEEPADIELHRSIGIQAMALGKTSLAVQVLQQTLAAAPDDPGTIFALARAEMEVQHVDAAEKLFRQYVKVRPSDAGAHFGLGRVLNMQQKPDAARNEFLRSVELQPSQDAGYYELGQLSLDTRDDATAAAWFQKALARSPSHGGALTGMGIIEYRAHKYTEAEALLRRAIVAAPNYDVAHHYLGLSLSRLDRQADADVELERAIQLAPPRP